MHYEKKSALRLLGKRHEINRELVTGRFGNALQGTRRRQRAGRAWFQSRLYITD
jgi:hypothetical protein